MIQLRRRSGVSLISIYGGRRNLANRPMSSTFSGNRLLKHIRMSLFLADERPRARRTIQMTW
jgi:hypothetical protein